MAVFFWLDRKKRESGFPFVIKLALAGLISGFSIDYLFGWWCVPIGAVFIGGIAFLVRRKKWRPIFTGCMIIVLIISLGASWMFSTNYGYLVYGMVRVPFGLRNDEHKLNQFIALQSPVMNQASLGGRESWPVGSFRTFKHASSMASYLKLLKFNRYVLFRGKWPFFMERNTNTYAKFKGNDYTFVMSDMANEVIQLNRSVKEL